PDTQAITGKLTYFFHPLSPISLLDFDCVNNLVIDSVLFHQNQVPNTLINNLLTIYFGSTISTVDSLTIYYHGSPVNKGIFGSFNTVQDSTGNKLWTLSEPYGAKDWFPVKQTLNDKIDSLDVWLTVPSVYTAVSNGLLQSEYIVGNQKVSF